MGDMTAAMALRQKIANGDIVPGSSGQSGPRVGEGEFLCKVTEAEFKKNQAGDSFRGMVQVAVTYADDPAVVGGKFRLYIQTKDQKFLESSIALWINILVANGVSEEKIYDGNDTLNDIIAECMSQVNKLAIKGKLQLVINRKPKLGPTGLQATDRKGNPEFYSDIMLEETKALVSEAPASAPAAEAPAPAAAPATAPAAAPAKKPWAK